MLHDIMKQESREESPSNLFPYEFVAMSSNENVSFVNEKNLVCTHISLLWGGFHASNIAFILIYFFSALASSAVPSLKRF